MKIFETPSRRASMCFGSILLASLGGCTSVGERLQAQSRVNPATVAIYPGGGKEKTSSPCMLASSIHDTRLGAIDLDCFMFPEDQQTLPSERKFLAYGRAVETPGDRNRLTSILLKHSDDVCTAELGRLTANEAVTNTTLSILTTGFSTASTIVGGELAKSILSGGAALASGSRDHVNVHVYRNQIAQAVSQVIASERQRLGTEIRTNYGSSREKWSIDDAIRAVNDYHQQCSFYKGLELLLKAADDQGALQTYRDAREQQARREAINAEIRQLKADLVGVEGKAKESIEARISELSLERSKLGADVPPSDAPEKPVANSNGKPDAVTDAKPG